MNTLKINMKDLEIPEIITRSVAKSRGLKRYFTGKPCPSNHVSYRHTSSGSCCECSYLKTRQWRENTDPNHMRNLRSIHSKNYYTKHSEQLKEKSRKWRELNPEKNKQYLRQYQKENVSAFAHRSKLRELIKKNRVPSWADRECIKNIYSQCKRISEETGVKHHVDHIIPLQGTLVCGLHVENNLRIIPASKNLSKGRKLLKDI